MFNKTGAVAAFLMVSATLCLAQTALDFTRPTLDGKTISLSDYKGKVVVLDFWAMWCTACREAFPRLNGIQKEYGAKNLAVIGVDLDKAPAARVVSFAQRAGIAYPSVLDPDNAVAELYSIKGIPTLCVIDKQGAIAGTFRGFSAAEEKKINALIIQLLAK